MKLKNRLIIAIALVTALPGLRIAAATEPGPNVATTPDAAPEREYLLGDWGGARKSLADRGIELAAELTLEGVRNVQGGLREDDAFLGNLDLQLTVDTEAAGLWKNGTFFVYFIDDFDGGTQPTELAGDIQATSNIEAPETFKLYQIWYEQRWRDDAVSLLVGLHDLNSEFLALEYAGVFANSSFGITPDVAQVGPSIFPTATLAARLRFQPTAHSYIQAAVYDGVPGDPDDDNGTQITLRSDDGLFNIVEGGLVSNDDDAAPYKLAAGAWYHTSDFEDPSGTPRDENQGAYVMGELPLFRESDAAQGLGLFGHAGYADDERNVIEQAYAGGLSYTGLIPGRDADVAGLGFTTAVLSDSYRDSQPGLDRAETALELVYEATITPWFILKPDVQYVIDPASEPDIDNALLVGLRSTIIF